MTTRHLSSLVRRHISGRGVRWGFVLFCATVWLSAADAVSSIRLVNHHDFPIRLPVTLRNLAAGGASFGEQVPVQREGTDLVFVANLRAHENRELAFRANAAAEAPRRLLVAPVPSGLALTIGGEAAGVLAWDIVVEPARKRSASDAIVGTRADYAAKFAALALSFAKTNSGPVFDTWTARVTKSGIAVALELRVFHAGFVDVTARVVNESAPTHDVSAALVARWSPPPLREASVCYDNRRAAFAVGASTAFHETEGRHWHIQHGVDWLRANFARGGSLVWVNPFDPVFTLETPATAKAAAKFTVGNQAQYGREALRTADAFYFVTELARPTLRSYRDRVVENVLPARGESLDLTTRLALDETAATDDSADRLFVGSTAYRAQRVDGSTAELAFGVPAVRFGTSYFPYSTLGENFDRVKLPGMDREGFWPLAADTVNRWPLFADQIRVDLRLIKAMGFSLVRLHHLELLAAIEPGVRREYLDFLFGELRHLGLRALLDVYASPAQIAELLGRYGDAVDGVEVENETLIWGIPLDRVAEWRELYTTIKRVAPHVQVHWTAQNNTGIFDRLAALGVGFDRIGLHSYVDTLDALPSARGWALAAGDYGARVGKPPVVTEWNYRGLTRMTPDARAQVLPQIFEGALATRSVADFYQFQFQETLAPNPVSGRGNLLRHYELFNLSRHPKREALEFERIVQSYIAPDDPARLVQIQRADLAEVELGADGRGAGGFAVCNNSARELRLHATIESPAEFRLKFSGPSELVLRPGEARFIRVEMATAAPRAGFYHAFVRLEGEGGLVRYAALEARLKGAPQLDFADAAAGASAVRYSAALRDGAADFWTRDLVVVYGQDAPVVEVETAIAIAQTLESATGLLVPYFQLGDLPTALRDNANLIVVGTRETNAAVNEIGAELPAAKSGVTLVRTHGREWLAVHGASAEAVKDAGMDFILRYWPRAKDSAAGRVGLAEKKLPRGVDPAKLP